MANKFDIHKTLEAFKRTQRTLPIKIARKAENAFKQSFVKQRFYDDNSDPWKARKNKKDNGRAILVKSGRLKRSIQASKITLDQITISTDVAYAGVHNFGEGYMPKRQFIGKSRKLNREVIQTIKTELKSNLPK